MITDVKVFLIYIIQSEWIKNLQTSILAFDIAQFFSSLNHQLLTLILNKAGFDSKIFFLFSNYLIGKKTQYLWNDFISSFFNVDVDFWQGLALSPILLAFYISLIFHIFEKISRNLNIPVSFLFFVDNGLLF